ncbi:hypothetical protein [Sporosarcina sp. HYO08]|uniref:hypothetical protein n=1 Tax=Sporosarcina sp. HYO08 TaxID=1759557 RepID=UPI000795CEB2|nr:hypothetical protein [Sporosarcina sp. HYO08]KXH80645.1 hypothetical protein AU377_07830 [Sporosarcina sp. HYO08]
MKRCKNCKRKPGFEKRVNCEGVLFCSDDCYEEYEGSSNDYDHPYIDDYEAIRFEYIEWMKHYENDLYEGRLEGICKKQVITESIDFLIDEFYDYDRLEGADGVFSAEIYHHLLAFEDLKSKVIHWTPTSSRA